MIGLPTLAALDGLATTRIWLAIEPTDMRCGFDRLAQRAAAVTGQDPLSGHLFLFRSRGGDRLKILYFDRDGYVLWYKRLEEGTFKWPRIGVGDGGAAGTNAGSPAAPVGRRSIELRGSELAMILDGIDLASVKRGKRYRRDSLR